MKIKGLDTVLKALTIDEGKIKTALEQGGKLILGQAKSNISQQEGNIANSYNMFITKTETGYVVNVGSDLDLSAYFEFGTGDFVVVPPETTDAYTMQWFVNGKGKLHAVPHLYPAYRQHRAKVVELIKNSLSL